MWFKQTIGSKSFIVSFLQVSIFLVAVITIIFIGALTAATIHELRPEKPEDLLYVRTGQVIRQCHIPITYTYSKNVNKRLRKATNNAIKYWNSVYGGELFVKMSGISFNFKDPRIGNLVLIDVIKKDEYHKMFRDEDLARVIYGPISSEGCASGNIVVKEHVVSRKTSFKAGLETIMRHELGHILGLRHSKDVRALMYPAANPRRIKVKNLTKTELEAFRMYYSK